MPTVVPFRRNAKARACGICRIPLKPTTPSWWTTCAKCFAYARFGRAVQLMRELRP